MPPLYFLAESIVVLMCNESVSGHAASRPYLRQSITQPDCPVEISSRLVLVGRGALAFRSRTLMGFPGSVQMVNALLLRDARKISNATILSMLESLAYMV